MHSLTEISPIVSDKKGLKVRVKQIFQITLSFISAPSVVIIANNIY